MDEAKQVERWVDQYLELYSRENFVIAEALDDIEHLLVLDLLDSERTEVELSKTIDALVCGKAAGEDGIRVIVTPLHCLLRLCWREGTVTLDMLNDKIITKNNCYFSD